MKLNALMLFKKSIFLLAACCFAIACNNKAENNSTDEGMKNKRSDSNSMPSGNIAKINAKTGKASIGMEKTETREKMRKDKMGYYNYTEVLPVYSGGQEALESYITNNIEYPQEAIDNSIEGTVNVQFAVDEKGNISNVKTIGPEIGYGLEQEAVKVVAAMPQWSPGQVNGKKVKTWRILPITYRLES